jgi:hypothetical protein
MNKDITTWKEQGLAWVGIDHQQRLSVRKKLNPASKTAVFPRKRQDFVRSFLSYSEEPQRVGKIRVGLTFDQPPFGFGVEIDLPRCLRPQHPSRRTEHRDADDEAEEKAAEEAHGQDPNRPESS